MVPRPLGPVWEPRLRFDPNRIPMHGTSSSRVECTAVRETAGGWLCTVSVSDAQGQREHEVRLAWCDHDYWSGGAQAPGDLTQRLVKLLIEARGSTLHVDSAVPWPLPAKFDAAKARRWCPSLDDDLRHAG